MQLERTPSFHCNSRSTLTSPPQHDMRPDSPAVTQEEPLVFHHNTSRDTSSLMQLQRIPKGSLPNHNSRGAFYHKRGSLRPQLSRRCALPQIDRSFLHIATRKSALLIITIEESPNSQFEKSTLLHLERNPTTTIKEEFPCHN